jgi:hypothetical protein
MHSVSKSLTSFIPAKDIAPLVEFAVKPLRHDDFYDLRFPEMARMLALSGANILVAPSGWVQGDLKFEHWQTMIKARALETWLLRYRTESKSATSTPATAWRSIRWPDAWRSWEKPKAESDRTRFEVSGRRCAEKNCRCSTTAVRMFMPSTACKHEATRDRWQINRC